MKKLLVLLFAGLGLTGCIPSPVDDTGNGFDHDSDAGCYMVHVAAKKTGKKSINEETYMRCTEEEAKAYVASMKQSLKNQGYTGAGSVVVWYVQKDDSYCD